MTLGKVRKKTIGIVVGEPSGDLIGGNLIQALNQSFPNLNFIGIAGPKMKKAGAESLFNMNELSFHGYSWDVLKKIPHIYGIRQKLIAYFTQNPPDVFIGIDAPDFNLFLEKKLKQKGIPTLHYVSPSVWAWRSYRIRKIKKSIHKMLVVFPFEQDFYQQKAIPVTYVGHPLADVFPLLSDQQDARNLLKIDAKKFVVALLPGSRKSEVRHLANLFIKTAYLILQNQPETVFLVPFATKETKDIFEISLFQQAELHRNKGIDLETHFQLLFGHSQFVIESADIVLTAPGTATLECLLLKCPMVVAYRTSSLHWLLGCILKMMGLIHTKYISLPNILANREIVPEFLQNEAVPEKLMESMYSLLADKKRLAEIQQAFLEIHQTLKQDNAHQLVKEIGSYLQEA